MSFWSGIVISRTDAVRAALARRKIDLPPGEGEAVVAVRGGTLPDLDRLAEEVANESASVVLSLFCVTSVDAYSVVEFGPGGMARRLAYSGEGDGWLVEGEPRPWEADLHFSETRERFLEHLELYEAEEEAWSAEDLAAAAEAYDTRSVADLPRRPPLTRSNFESFAARYGEPVVVADRRGVIARLLGFG